MSVAHTREHSLCLSYDANDPSPSGESRMVAGVPAAPFRGGVNTSSTHCNPAWINLAGSIAGLDFGTVALTLSGRAIRAAGRPGSPSACDPG